MNANSATKILLALIASIIVFHLCILFKAIPYSISWGGRLENDAQMYVFEMLSIAMNAILAMALLIKGRFIREVMPLKVVNFILWFFLLLFIVNRIGNVFAKTPFEKFFANIS